MLVCKKVYRLVVADVVPAWRAAVARNWSVTGGHYDHNVQFAHQFIDDLSERADVDGVEGVCVTNGEVEYPNAILRVQIPYAFRDHVMW